MKIEKEIYNVEAIVDALATQEEDVTAARNDLLRARREKQRHRLLVQLGLIHRKGDLHSILINLFSKIPTLYNSFVLAQVGNCLMQMKNVVIYF